MKVNIFKSIDNEYLKEVSQAIAEVAYDVLANHSKPAEGTKLAAARIPARVKVPSPDPDEANIMGKRQGRRYLTPDHVRALPAPDKDTPNKASELMWLSYKEALAFFADKYNLELSQRSILQNFKQLKDQLYSRRYHHPGSPDNPDKLSMAEKGLILSMTKTILQHMISISGLPTVLEEIPYLKDRPHP